jgi:hypothetical protein
MFMKVKQNKDMKKICDSAGMTLHGFGMGASVVGGFSDAHKSALRKLCGNGFRNKDYYFFILYGS